jgi:DNA-binding NtrC family response regulator
MSAPDDRRGRVLVLAPAGRDAVLTQAVLERAGIPSAICAHLGELCDALADGAAAALVTEESMVGMDVQRLAAWTAAQEPWSDLPFIVLRSRGSINDDAAHELSFLRTSANITLVERPIGTGTLVSTVTAALRARRQYEVKDSLEAVAQSEHRHRTLAEALPQLVWTCCRMGAAITSIAAGWNTPECTTMSGLGRTGWGW